MSPFIQYCNYNVHLFALIYRPLHEACENGHVELVRLLLSYGADPLLATYAGQAPIELAEHHPPVKRLLEQHIRDVQGKDEAAWEFRGTGSWAEEQFDNGYDATASPPQSANDSVDGFEFESSELPLPPIYMLKVSHAFVTWTTGLQLCMNWNSFRD